MTDDDENVMDKIVQEMEDEYDVRGPARLTQTLSRVGNAPLSNVPWLDQGSVHVLHDYIHYLATATDVPGCIGRLRSLADFLSDEADKLEAKGAVNFQRSFDLH